MKIGLALIALAVVALTGSAHGGVPYPPPPSDAMPTWSPDGSVIAFRSSRSPGTMRVVNPNGSGDKPIPVPSTNAYAFSPDWFWIAFPSGGSGAPLVVMRPDGSQRRELGSAAYGVPPSWAPDGLFGDGGNDVVDARDGGDRDVVSCGTNRSATTAPTGEADVAYVDRGDVVSRDCETTWYLGEVSPPTGKISLTITLIPNGAKPRVGRRTYTLRCRPAAGTLPQRKTACSKLLQVQNPFAPVPRDQACTQIYGGPQEAIVIGVYGGKPVWARFTRIDGCQISRWNRVRFLFPIRVGVT